MDLRLCLCLALLGTAVLVTLTTASEYFPTEPAEAATIPCSGMVSGQYYDLTPLMMPVTSVLQPYSAKDQGVGYMLYLDTSMSDTITTQNDPDQNWPCGSLSYPKHVPGGLSSYSGTSPNGGVDLFYPYGAEALCNNIETVRNTTIRVTCDPTVEKITILSASEEPPGSCNYFIEVSSQYGCPASSGPPPMPPSFPLNGETGTVFFANATTSIACTATVTKLEPSLTNGLLVGRFEVTNLYDSPTACPATSTGELSSEATFVIQLKQNDTVATWDSTGSGALKVYAVSVH